MLYLGTYAGLFVADDDVTEIPGVPDASWLELSADRTVLYVTNESDDGTVTALRTVDHRIISRQPTLGSAPTHLTVHPSGRWLLTANYGSGTVAVHPLAEDGTIEPATHVTEPGSHAHQVLVDPSGEWVITVDIGADTITTHRLHHGTLEQHAETPLPAGTGPRHLTFHPAGTHGYLLAEYRSELRPFTWSAGEFTLGDPVSTLTTTEENYPAEIAVSADGRFCYASNRGANSIAVLTEDLRLLGTVPTGGDWPRHLTLTPDERRILVCNQRSGTLTALDRDQDTGLLGSATTLAHLPEIAMVLPT